MVYSVRFLAIITIALAIMVGIGFAQYGSSASYNLQWKVIESGGNEGDDVTSASYRLSSCIGQSTPVISGPSSSASYDFYPGFRKIDLDLRYPYSWFTLVVEYSADTSFGLRWAAIDTTIEDGQGWGVWNYDIQYKIGAAGGWTDWLVDTEDTMATFGSEIPVDVTPGEVYHFRLRAQDKARNEAPWSDPWMDQDSTIVNYVIEFCVWTVAPGLPTDAANYATLQFYQDNPSTPTTVDLWEGTCAQVWCVPNTEAEMTRMSSASDTQERWAVNTPTDDTLWVIDGAVTDYDVWYWHQLKPVIVLDGADVTHTVSTLFHDQFGAGHLESFQHTSWSEWTDYYTLIEFSDSTTGVPIRMAIPTDSTRFHDVTAFFTDTIHYLAAGNLVTVQTNFGDSVSVDDVWYVSPYNTNWFELSTHDIAVHDTVAISSCDMWIFDNWEDAPAITDTFRSVTISSDSTFTALFHHELKFDVVNPSGNGTPSPAVGGYWFVEGDTVTGSMDTTGVSGWMLAGFIGTGSVLSGAGTDYWFLIDDCSSVEWQWVPESGDLCTLWVYSHYGHPTPSGMWVVPCGTDIFCSVEDSSYEEGAWQYCTGWYGDGLVVPATGDSNIIEVTVAGNGWLVWEWNDVDERPLVINSTPGVHGPPIPDVGIHWYPTGSVIDAFVDNNPDGSWWCTGYDGWGDVVPTSADSLHFTLTVPTHIDWQWMFWEGALDTLWVFSPFGDPLPGVGMHIYPEGLDITCYVATPAAGRYCTGWLGDGSVPATGDTNWVNFTLTDFSTLTWIWDDHPLLPFTVMNPTGYGSPIPPVGTIYYTPGTVINASVTSPDGAFYCVGYHGFGDVPAMGYGDNITFTLLTASGIEWLWDDDVVTLTVTAPAYSDAIPPVGVTYHPVGRHIVASALDTVYTTSEERHILTGWIGDGGVVPAVGDSDVVEFDMTANGTIQWNYLDQYNLTLLHAGLPGGIDPDTLGVEGWYEDGDSAILIVDYVVYDGATPYVFTDWDDGGAGAYIEDATSESTFVEMDDAYTITANFAEGVNITITKTPLHDTPGWIFIDGDTFFTGTQTDIWVRGSTHEIEVSTVDSIECQKYVWNWWRDDHFEAVNRLVAPTTDTIFYADYNSFWHIILQKSPDSDTLGSLTYDATTLVGLASVRQDLWWENGSVHDFEVSTPDSAGLVKYYFNQWSDSEANPVHTTYGPVHNCDSIVALYDQYFLCRVEKNPLQDHGRIFFEGVWFDDIEAYEFWASIGDNIDLGVSAADTVGDYDSLYIFTNWETAETDTMITWVVGGPDTITAFYNAIDVYLDIELGHEGVYPEDSVVWLVNDGDSVGLAAVYTLTSDDSIKVYNLSTVNVDLGLNVDAIIDTTDLWVIDPYWSPHYWEDLDRFVLMAQFNDATEPPIVWERGRDYIDYSLTWAENTPGRIFGTGGENIEDVTGNNTEMIWLQFITPTQSTNPTNTRCIVLKMSAKPHLP